MNRGHKRSRAKHACKECNQRRIRCDVMDKLPCTNCEASQATCLILPSKRGRYPRNPRQSNVKQEAATATAAAVPAVAENGNLFFGESNFLTLVPSGPQETQRKGGKERLSFPLNHPNPPLMTGVSPGTERYLNEEGALTFPPFATCLPVVQAYFKWFHPCFPVLDRPATARKFAAMDLSPFLFQAMLFIGATYCEEAAVVAMGFRDRTEAKSLLYTRARLLFDADWEKDRITLIQGVFLMSFWRGGSSDVRDVRYWLGVVITLAETLGLHRSTKLTTRDAQMARIRRRIWWSVYVREGQSAASLGLPMRIRNEDCDIEPLTAQDAANDSDDNPLTALGAPTPEHIVYPVKMAELARLLGQIIDVHFIPGRSPTAPPEMLHLQTSLEEWKESLPDELRRISAEDGPSVLSCLLHLAYNHLRILLCRNGFLRHHEADTQAALGAASQISRIAEDMLDRRTLQVSPHFSRWRRADKTKQKKLPHQYSTVKCTSSPASSPPCASTPSTSRRPPTASAGGSPSTARKSASWASRRCKSSGASTTPSSTCSSSTSTSRSRGASGAGPETNMLVPPPLLLLALQG